jgi:hypothetical protein
VLMNKSQLEQQLPFFVLLEAELNKPPPHA